MVELRLVARWARDLDALAARIGAFVPGSVPSLVEKSGGASILQR